MRSSDCQYSVQPHSRILTGWQERKLIRMASCRRTISIELLNRGTRQPQSTKAKQLRRGYYYSIERRLRASHELWNKTSAAVPKSNALCLTMGYTSRPFAWSLNARQSPWVFVPLPPSVCTHCRCSDRMKMRALVTFSVHLLLSRL